MHAIVSEREERNVDLFAMFHRGPCYLYVYCVSECVLLGFFPLYSQFASRKAQLKTV